MECVPECTAMLLVNRSIVQLEVRKSHVELRVILGCITDVPVFKMLPYSTETSTGPALAQHHPPMMHHRWAGLVDMMVVVVVVGGRSRVRYHAVVSQCWP